MLTRPGKSDAEVQGEAKCYENEAKDRDVAKVIKTPYMNACAPT